MPSFNEARCSPRHIEQHLQARKTKVGWVACTRTALAGRSRAWQQRVAGHAATACPDVLEVLLSRPPPPAVNESHRLSCSAEALLQYLIGRTHAHQFREFTFGLQVAGNPFIGKQERWVRSCRVGFFYFLGAESRPKANRAAEREAAWLTFLQSS